METIHTLTQLLKNSGCQYDIYDLGRRIQKIDNTLFSDVEQGKQPYPFPLQKQAHLAISYWNEQKQPWIWFLKFKLDERGLLNQADVGNFLKFVLEAMGTRLSGEISEEQQEKLSNNPYTFKPSEDKMAVFHSQVRAELDLATSQYYEHAQHYFTGELGWDNWQTVGIQGITDMCARLGSQQNGVAIRKAFNKLPSEPLYATLGALEHTQINDKLAQRLQEMAENEINSDEPDLFLLSALVRALSGAEPSITNAVINQVLASPRLSHQEVLIGLAGRSWHALQDPAIAEQFLLRLAQTGNQNLFNQLFADLVMIPALRMVFLPLLNSNPSPELANALIELQQATKSQ
ncbi:conserved hypothetical protein [Vibrio chagasii]|uniref:DUF3549 family protein n=1 Tax=Vibrio chagasii TaxID=170679 RepID=UPI001EFCF2A0|nr:DUF3549 family protein [Vibrio chagasii]MCG9676070.1 DUF3549 family protein [Vibrio chagasii]CAH6952407.1 conserved hypothetical protein [Vibrio chagasii]CAH6960739.1 conserved hypothetical protein [Vibrio chagasii]CAH6998803.1 conserved hypothetical protein [Vibrio chagasii]CAH7161465.1 conserved hypothetical protein [Vibrio chagasii]